MNLPRIMITGASSGSGKTTAVCTILSLFKRHKISVKAFKCGPDYIDPMFHKTVSGVSCMNLDPFFCSSNYLRYLLAKNSGEHITVIEGAMGYYDGTGNTGTDKSAYTVASITRTPVILVIDAKSSAASLLAVIEGFLHFMPESRIKGVLFNRISPMNYKNIKRLMYYRFKDAVIPVGYIPNLPEKYCIPSRHLGLVTAAEIPEFKENIERISDLCESTVDIEAILSLADTAEEYQFSVPEIHKFDKINLAVAYDNAFCFYYEDTLNLLTEMGAEIHFFSPLHNEPVPEDSDGLLIGGGYPELYAEKLERNTISKTSVYKAVTSKMPTIAECGGFQYIGAKLNGRDMCNVLGHSSFNTGKLVRFGYVNITSHKSGLLGPEGTALCGHEFHYFDSSDNGNDFTAKKVNGKEWECSVMTETLYAGYPHLYLPANLSATEAFYKKCLAYKENKR